MSDRKKFWLPAVRLIVLAAVTGALAGAVAVYVTTTYRGNNQPPGIAAEVSPGDADPADVAACAAKSAAAKAAGDAATGEVAAMTAADPPQSLKTLAFNGPDGKPMTLADRAGKTLIVNLWATWCFPCREEMPALNALQKELGSDRFEVMAINVDTGDDTKPKKFLAETGIDVLAPYRENTLDLFNGLKVRGLALGLPVTLLVDGDGCMLAHMNGPAAWSSNDAKRFVQAAIGS